MSTGIGALNGISRIEAVTPSDSTDIVSTRAILIESDGAVAVIPAGQTTSVTLPNLLGGVWHPMQVTRVLATGTDASTVHVGR